MTSTMTIVAAIRKRCRFVLAVAAQSAQILSASQCRRKREVSINKSTSSRRLISCLAANIQKVQLAATLSMMRVARTQSKRRTISVGSACERKESHRKAKTWTCFQMARIGTMSVRAQWPQIQTRRMLRVPTQRCEVNKS